MATEEVAWMPGEWNVGDVVQIERNGELVVRGRITEVLGNGLFKIEVERGGIAARFRARST